uniref:F-box domain-containing protein n=1 Tax=Strongyloides stercoralis TaxID=6248 RepID=A0A913I332_STRER
MESNMDVSFLELMDDKLLRKNILKWIPTFKDLQNLAKTCRTMNLYIKNDIVRKEMFWYRDEECMNLTCKDRSINGIQTLNADNINILPGINGPVVSRIANNFNGEVVASSNCIFVKMDGHVSYLKREDNEFFKVLVQKMNLNYGIRNNATILDFTGADPYCAYFILYALCYLEHENIRKIKIQIRTLMSDCSGSDNILCDIFKGLPNLCELVVFDNINLSRYDEIIEEKQVLNHVFRGLSKKVNPTFVLTNVYDTYETFDLYSKLFLGFADKYNVRIKFNLISLLPLPRSAKEPDSIYSQTNFLKVKNCVTSITNNIPNSRVFSKVINDVWHFENLEMIILSLRFSDIKKGLQRMNKLGCNNNTPSLKHCKYLKRVGLHFEGYQKKRHDLCVSTFYNNLIFLASLMPSSVKRFDLTCGFELTSDITRIISGYMPNIKLLLTCNVSYKDSDCLCAFKNLEALIFYDCHNIDIPETVEFLAILQGVSKNNNTYRVFDGEILNNYAKKFRKSLRTTRGDYIFFNDIMKWDKYRRIITWSYY